MSAQILTRWLIPGPTVYTDTEVEADVQPETYYAKLASLIAATKGPRARSPRDAIFIAGWELHIDQTMTASTTLRDLLRDAGGRGVAIRGLLDFDQKANIPEWLGRPSIHRHNANTAAGLALRELGAEALFDNQQRFAGSHHQKLVFLTAGGKLHGFCGGIDLAGRWGWRDVQCHLIGPAAAEILRILNLRWNSLTGRSRSVPSIGSGTRPGALHAVQVVATFGKEDWFARQKGRKYAKSGEYGVHAMLLNAIQEAKRFIFVEDQYFLLSKMASKANLAVALASQLRKNPRLIFTAIIARTEIINSELEQGWFRRRVFIEELTEGVGDAKNRVRIYQYKSAFSWNFGKNFVHSKTWIFDDEFAVIGSANCNRRGMTHDSEAAVGVASRALFAKRLRVSMLQSHLSASTAPKGWYAVKDLEKWPSGIKIIESSKSPLERYNPYGGRDSFGLTPGGEEEEQWNRLLDPDDVNP